jgi:cytochrome b561
MRIRNLPLGYGAAAMSLHWAIAVLVLAAWLTRQFGDELPRGAPREAGLFVHISLGLAIIAFVVAARRACVRVDVPAIPHVEKHFTAPDAVHDVVIGMAEIEHFHG